jgi:hypothetical protein
MVSLYYVPFSHQMAMDEATTYEVLLVMYYDISNLLRSKYSFVRIWVSVMMLNPTFSNISVMSWRSVLSVEKAGEKHRPAASH